jgi:hypothetical protein
MSLVGATSRWGRLISVLVLSAVVMLGLVPWRLVAAEPKTKKKPVAAKPAVDPVRYVAKVCVVAGQPASIMVGEVSPDGKKGDRIESDFTVTELPPAGQKK